MTTGNQSNLPLINGNHIKDKINSSPLEAQANIDLYHDILFNEEARSLNDIFSNPFYYANDQTSR